MAIGYAPEIAVYVKRTGSRRVGLVVSGVGDERAVNLSSSRAALYPYIAVWHAGDLLSTLRAVGKEMRDLVGRRVRCWVYFVNVASFRPVEVSIRSEGDHLRCRSIEVAELAVAHKREAIGKGDGQVVVAMQFEKGARNGRQRADFFHVFCLLSGQKEAGRNSGSTGFTGENLSGLY